MRVHVGCTVVVIREPLWGNASSECFAFEEITSQEAEKRKQLKELEDDERRKIEQIPAIAAIPNISADDVGQDEKNSVEYCDSSSINTATWWRIIYESEIYSLSLKKFFEIVKDSDQKKICL